MTEKTQAMRTLEGKRINYEAIEYPDDRRDAVEIAVLLGVPPAQVFKTLVVLPPQSGKKPLLVMIPAPAQLDLKKLAEAVGTKKLKMATHREAEQLTSLQVGGISAVALLGKPFSVYIDDSALSLVHVFVSAGKRGIQLKVAVADLIELTSARVADVTSVL